ncbi:MAG TPA: hypothetical protein VIE89_26650 [Candidatus Binatia bacterium]|jgi:hypothetical protein
MKIVISLGLALLLVVIGAAHSLWSDDDLDKIAAAAKHDSSETLSEASENWNDDRLLGPLPLVSAVTSDDSCPVPSSSLSDPSMELNSIRESSRIYKLNSRLLI